MSQSRRQFIATGAAVAVAPALPAVAVAPLVEPWPPEILELERVAAAIFKHAHDEGMFNELHRPVMIEGNMELNDAFCEYCLKRGLGMYNLRRLTPKHKPAQMALAQYLADGTLPVSPSPVPPFLP